MSPRKNCSGGKSSPCAARRMGGRLQIVAEGAVDVTHGHGSLLHRRRRRESGNGSRRLLD
jgi:hypothetical protein